MFHENEDNSTSEYNQPVNSNSQDTTGINQEPSNQHSDYYESNTQKQEYVPNFTLWSDGSKEEKGTSDQIEPQQPARSEQNYMEYHINNSQDYYRQNQNNNTDFGRDQQQNSYNNKYHNQPVSKKKMPKILKLVGAAVIFGLVAGAAFQGVNYASRMLNPNSAAIGNNDNAMISPEKRIETTPIINGLKTSTVDVSQVVENTMPSIVAITSTVTQTYKDFFGNIYNEDSEGSGSGIIIDKNEEELLIVTNNHVIASAKNIAVKFIDKKIVKAVVKGTDEAADLAVISIAIKDIEADTLNEIKVAKLGDSDKVKVGEQAIAIGNAMGYGQSVTGGYVSAKDRTVDIDNRKMVLLQTDAAINPGNSGGALLNAQGEVIGINSVKFTSNAVEGMGYAIPISSAVPIINELMKREIIKEEEKGFLGLSGADIEEDNIYKMPSGVYVNTVNEGSPAETAGVLQGDIITKINGIEVKTFNSLRERVMSYRAGTEIELTIMRRVDGTYKEEKVTATLGNRPLEADTDTEDSINEPVNPEDSNPNYNENEDIPTIPYDGGQSIPDIFDFFN